MRQLLTALFLSASAVALSGLAGSAQAADLPGTYRGGDSHVVYGCAPREEVILFKHGKPTPPGRTPYFTCVTGTVLLPGDIPPPPEYCCH